MFHWLRIYYHPCQNRNTFANCAELVIGWLSTIRISDVANSGCSFLGRLPELLKLRASCVWLLCFRCYQDEFALGSKTTEYTRRLIHVSHSPGISLCPSVPVQQLLLPARHSDSQTSSGSRRGRHRNLPPLLAELLGLVSVVVV